MTIKKLEGYIPPKEKAKIKAKKDKLKKIKLNKYRRDRYRRSKGLKTEDEIKAENKALNLKYRKSWKIIMTSQNSNLTDIVLSSKKEDALEKFYKILNDNNNNVRFPIKFIHYGDEIIPAKYELLLLKKRLDGETLETLFKNEIGQFSPVKTNNDKWQIFLKSELLVEEQFWVYGCNPLHDRKNFYNIYNDILIKNVKHVKYPIKRVMVLLNKLIIENEDYEFDMIICKNKSDCVRLYNELEKETNINKIRSILFAGFVIGETRKRLIRRIMEKTGWDIIKIYRSTTKP